MKRKYSGSTTAAMATFLVSGVLVSVLGVRQVERHTTHEVWGINGNWPVGTLIRPEILRKVRIDNDELGVSNQRLLLGKQLAQSKKDGQPIQPAELRTPVKTWLAQQIPDNKVLYTFAPNKGSIPFSQLRNGDRFDVLVTGKGGVRTVARDATLIGALAKPSAKPTAAAGLSGLALPPLARDQAAERTSLVIAIDPEEVYPLAHVGRNERVSIVLHSSILDIDGERHSIEPEPTHRQVELLSGLKRSTVTIKL
ncbi:hypothetical protein [uncultured Pseudomonas sp.]|uniref:hypothetical protein n=1 Tax=uncultured Pseudomonas sp. TaxID=114707 RepID=UPI00260E4006|nr:hypothetical protein [uncultured Pseudomonas sp.]